MKNLYPNHHFSCLHVVPGLNEDKSEAPDISLINLLAWETEKILSIFKLASVLQS